MAGEAEKNEGGLRPYPHFAKARAEGRVPWRNLTDGQRAALEVLKPGSRRTIEDMDDFVDGKAIKTPGLNLRDAEELTRFTEWVTSEE
jgi:hypothetical protein